MEDGSSSWKLRIIPSDGVDMRIVPGTTKTSYVQCSLMLVSSTSYFVVITSTWSQLSRNVIAQSFTKTNIYTMRKVVDRK